jgi:hypothetical protein
LAPICVLPLVASDPFQDALATVTLDPLWDQVPLQPWESCWLPA